MCVFFSSGVSHVRYQGVSTWRASNEFRQEYTRSRWWEQKQRSLRQQRQGDKHTPGRERHLTPPLVHQELFKFKIAERPMMSKLTFFEFSRLDERGTPCGRPSLLRNLQRESKQGAPLIHTQRWRRTGAGTCTSTYRNFSREYVKRRRGIRDRQASQPKSDRVFGLVVSSGSDESNRLLHTQQPAEMK